MLAIDAGNSKTDVAIIAADGTVRGVGAGRLVPARPARRHGRRRGPHAPGGQGARGRRARRRRPVRPARGRLPGQRRLPGRARGPRVRDRGPGLGWLDRGLQRHLRPAPGGAGRAPWRRGRVRGRHQLRRSAAGWPHRALRRRRSHLRRLGRRRRPVAGGDVVGCPGRGRARSGHRAHRGAPPPGRADDHGRADRGCPPRAAVRGRVHGAHTGAVRRRGDRRRGGLRPGTPSGRGGRGPRRRRHAPPRRPGRAHPRRARRRRAHRGTPAADGRDRAAGCRPRHPWPSRGSSGRRRSSAPPCSGSTGSTRHPTYAIDSGRPSRPPAHGRWRSPSPSSPVAPWR